MILEIKYEYEVKPKKAKMGIYCVNDGTTTTIDSPNDCYRGTSYATIKEDALYNDVVKAFSEYLKKEVSAINIVIKKIKRLSIINL